MHSVHLLPMPPLPGSAGMVRPLALLNAIRRPHVGGLSISYDIIKDLAAVSAARDPLHPRPFLRKREQRLVVNGISEGYDEDEVP